MEERLAEQMLLYLRSEVAGARDEMNRYRVLGQRVESEVNAEYQARVAAEIRFADERKVQQEELQGELRQQKQRSEAELAERDEKVRALEAEAEGKSWTSTWDATAWASWGGS